MSTRRIPYSIDVVVPCYQEQEALPFTAPKILAFFQSLIASDANSATSFRLLLVDDGSSDQTWAIIEGLSRDMPQIEGVKLSRNYGHQAAMLSGLSLATADAVVTMDADLQDDVNAVFAMLSAYESGADMALGVRQDRSSDSHGKRGFANAYYRLLQIMGVNVIENHADFRLMSKRALQALLAHGEVNLFLRGLIPTIGFNVSIVPYARQARVAGDTKYTIAKMVRLAIDGITSFSVAPLRYVAFMGGLVFMGSIITGLYVFLTRLLTPGTTVPGWASTMLPLLFIGGLQILCTGVVGEYIGKIYLEVKQRPRFIIEERTKADE